MLCLLRKEGQWVTITHKSGDIMHVKVVDTKEGSVRIVFDDGPRNFEISRPEAKNKEEKA